MAQRLTKRAKARNQQRAERAELAMTEFYDPDNDANVIDLLTDVRHFCQVAGIDFEDALRMSEIHFRAEINGED